MIEMKYAVVKCLDDESYEVVAHVPDADAVIAYADQYLEFEFAGMKITHCECGCLRGLEIGSAWGRSTSTISKCMLWK